MDYFRFGILDKVRATEVDIHVPVLWIRITLLRIRIRHFNQCRSGFVSGFKFLFDANPDFYFMRNRIFILCGSGFGCWSRPPKWCGSRSKTLPWTEQSDWMGTSVQRGPDRIGLLDKPPASSAFLPSRASSRTPFPTLPVPPMRVWSNTSEVVYNLYCVRVAIKGKLAVET